jgi:N6-L-threonylcarbamoyladenine synthase
MKKLILAIETSCDETALALVSAESGNDPEFVDGLPKFKVLKNLVSSQIKIHRPFGGVVPNLAKREHLKNLPILYQQIFGKEQRAKSKWENIDLITVTVGPGLEPALWTGINFAQELAKKYKKPLIGANHLEGHLYSFLLQKKARIPNFQFPISKIFPAIALIVSGGHTILLLMKDLKKWKKLGETRDDAAGEAFDKVARLLDLPYPGGPEIEKIAKKGNPAAINFPRPMMHQKNYDFSFSGLKTAVFYHLRNETYENTKIYESTKNKNQFRNFVPFRNSVSQADIAASFQEAAIDVLVLKTLRAAKEFSAKDGSPPDACLLASPSRERSGPARQGRAGVSGGKTIIKAVMLSGGVAANKQLRKKIRQETRKMGLNFFVPDFRYNTDNAVMIAIAGYMTYLRGKKYKLAAQGNLNI